MHAQRITRLLAVAVLIQAVSPSALSHRLLPTRRFSTCPTIRPELYKDFNAAFKSEVAEGHRRDGGNPGLHGGSGAQARSVIDGLDADVDTCSRRHRRDRRKDRQDPSRTGRASPATTRRPTSTIVFWCARAIRRAS